MIPGFQHEARATALVIAAGEAVGEAGQALRLAGFDRWARVAPAQAGPALAETSTLVVALLEQVDGATLEWLLPILAERCAERGMVVSLGPDQIDAVAGQLIGRPAQLLVAPDLATLTAAMVLARGSGGNQVRETGDEDERLLRISEEVARIAATLLDIAGRSRATGQTVADRSAGFAASPAEAAQPSAAEIRRVIRARRVRARFVAQELIENPGWDMLLDLFAAEREGARVSISSLCIAAAVPATTALRWLGRMTATGLFERRPDPGDRRRVFIALSPAGRAAMAGYFAALADGGLPIA